MFKSTYRESVRPVPAAESRRLAMVDGVSIVLDHAKRYDTPRALWASVLVAALTSWKASDRFACGGDQQHAAMYPHRIAIARMITRRTQWVVLSAASDHPSNGYAMWVHGSMLAPSSDDGVVVVDDRLVGKCSSRRTVEPMLKTIAHGAHQPTRWPVPSEWSAVTTGLRLGRVVRDARLPYLRN